MSPREQNLGRTVRFLLPSLKLKQPGSGSRTAEEDVHQFLMREFGGYTASSGTLFGFWKDSGGNDSYGEHRDFSVALTGDDKLPALKRFLAGLAKALGEECLYVEIGGEALLLYSED